jgi:hypothetical protein
LWTYYSRNRYIYEKTSLSDLLDELILLLLVLIKIRCCILSFQNILKILSIEQPQLYTKTTIVEFIKKTLEYIDEICRGVGEGMHTTDCI